jgi:hypothetical protein
MATVERESGLPIVALDWCTLAQFEDPCNGRRHADCLPFYKAL